MLKAKISLDKNLLTNLYIIQNKTIKEIENITGWKINYIYRKLREFNIKKDKTLRIANSHKSFMQSHLKPDYYTLYCNYCVEEMTIDEIANKYSLKRRPIIRLLRKYQLSKEVRKIDFSQIEYLYVEKDWTKQEICNYLKCNYKAVSSYIKNHNLHRPHLCKSKPQEECYKLTLKKFPKAIREYSDSRYRIPNSKNPLFCDIYIPETDTFIECQFYPSHGPEPFNSNNKKHLELLEKYYQKSHTTDWYKTIIDIWTKKDPLKREIAKKNNLKRLEFWSVKDYKEWLNAQ